MDTYFVAKRRLFRLLADSAASSGRRAPAVINTDDLYGRKILSYLSEYPGVKPFSYGLSESADIRGVINDLTVHGTTFDILTPTGACQTRCPIPGRHNVLNALAAVGTLYGLGFSLEKLCASLPMIHSVPGRMETVQSGQPFLVIVDYAHTPDALENLLDALKNITRGRLITVFGCGGDRDRSKRPKMGRAVSDRSDVTIVTSDNPRTEKPEDIIADILPGLVDGCVYEIIPDRRSAIRKAINLALEGDTVVIAGKGHETYQIIGKTSIPFDDRAEAGKALALRGFDK
jgi:UDP-N-acetylmuramoyl-L-alanyl-D-glutamate--2,6-diaminopimelate ligase